MDRLRKLKNKVVAPKNPSSHGRKDESDKPKYHFEEPENSPDELEIMTTINLRLRERMKELAVERRKDGTTIRDEDEDLNANNLFHNVGGYKEGLRRGDEKGRPRPYEYPPDAVVNGPFTPQDEEENPAADELFAGAHRSQKPKQPLLSPDVIEAVDRIQSAAAQASALGKFPTVRIKGEDPAADAIFEGRTRR